MALKKPAFENEPATSAAADVAQETNTAVAEKPAVTAAAPAAAPAEAPAPAPAADAPAAAVETAVAIAKASSTAVGAINDAAARAKAFKKEVEEMKGASSFDYGNYDVFKGNNGEIAQTAGDQVSLGRWAKVRLLSWDEHHEISPGEKGASTKDFVAYSKDGKVVDSVIGEELQSWVGKQVGEYVEYLRTTEEFDKTKVRRFVDTACALLGTDSGDGPMGSVIQITLSESSIPAFAKYQQQLQDNARCVAMGLPGFALPDDPFTFFFIREVAKKGDNSWTKLKISANLPAKI